MKNIDLKMNVGSLEAKEISQVRFHSIWASLKEVWVPEKVLHQMMLVWLVMTSSPTGLALFFVIVDKEIPTSAVWSYG